VFFVSVPIAFAAGLGTRSRAAAKPVNLTPPKILGTAQEGQLLRADPGTWQGSQPMQFAFQWSSCSAAGDNCAPVGQATDRIFVPRAAGGTLTVTVTATNSAGTSQAASAATDLLAPAPVNGPVATSQPSISGAVSVGGIATVDRGDWAGLSPFGFRYRWRLCTAQGGSCSPLAQTTAPRMRVPSKAEGHALRVLVLARNSAGSGYALSDPTAAVPMLGRPANVSRPTISGTPQEGQRLHADSGTWTGSQPMDMRYAWLRCNVHATACSRVDNGRDHTVTSGDVGHRLRVAVRAANRFGSRTATSDATAVVQAKPGPAAPQSTSRPTISGTVQQGQTLAASTGSWSGATPMSFHYQWARCDTQGRNCSAVTGSLTVATYAVTGADVGHRMIVQVKAHNSAGDGFADSLPTDTVRASQQQPSTSNTMSIASVALPDRLIVDRVQFAPNVVTSHSQPLVLRVHVSETMHGKAVSGAIVQGMAVPFNRLSSESEVTTGSDGWATLTYRVLPTFQLRRGNLVVMFVRARKADDSILAGVSTRRLISVRVG
jgi:hypothetical protein